MTKPGLMRVDAVRGGIRAGILGGGAEIAFIMAVAAASDISAAGVARGISASVGVAALPPAQLVFAGLLIHMALAIALGIAVAMACQALAGRLPHVIHVYALVPVALIGVWAFNFLVLLPMINPAFVQLVPYPVSFISKLLFGLAAAESLRRSART